MPCIHYEYRAVIELARVASTTQQHLHSSGHFRCPLEVATDHIADHQSTAVQLAISFVDQEPVITRWHLIGTGLCATASSLWRISMFVPSAKLLMNGQLSMPLMN